VTVTVTVSVTVPVPVTVSVTVPVTVTVTVSVTVPVSVTAQSLQKLVGGLKMTDINLPVPDDAPWLNLSKEEIEQLRQQKKELSEYGREKLKKLLIDLQKKQTNK